jgi:Peptidase family M28
LSDRLLSREVDPQREIQQLVEFDGRGPGTDAERRAAVHLKHRLEQLGRRAELEPIQVRPNYPAVFLILAILGIVGSVLSVQSAIGGFALLAAATLLALGELTGTIAPLRRLTPMRASQNVVSGEQSDKEGTLVLMAHYDAGRSGWLYDLRLPRGIGAFQLFFWSLFLILVCTLARLVGMDNLALTIVQFIPTVLLIASIPLFGDIALASTLPGANDNASGVATVLRLANRQLQNFDLWILFTGAEEGLLLGSRDWIKRHGKELDPATTVFVNVDTVGAGPIRHVTKEGLVLRSAFHPRLIELTETEGFESHAVTDAYAIRSAGFPAISIVGFDGEVEADALEDAFTACSQLIEAIDERALS